MQVGTEEARKRAAAFEKDDRRAADEVKAKAGGQMVLGDPSGDEWSSSDSEASTSSSAVTERKMETQAQLQQHQGWGLSDAFLLGIRSMGRAVLLSGKVVEAVSSEAQAAMGRYVQVPSFCCTRYECSMANVFFGQHLSPHKCCMMSRLQISTRQRRSKG